MVTNNDVIRAVNECSSELIDEFQQAPYSFLYESDLQATLFAKLRSSLPGRLTIPGNAKPHDQYEVSFVHSEYWKRIDIACIDVERAMSVEQRCHAGLDIYIYEIPLLVGIEIKYRKMGDRFGLSACLSDLTKLRDLEIQRPLVLGFIQDDTELSDFMAKRPVDCSIVPTSSVDDEVASINVITPRSRWSVYA